MKFFLREGIKRMSAKLQISNGKMKIVDTISIDNFPKLVSFWASQYFYLPVYPRPRSLTYNDPVLG